MPVVGNLDDLMGLIVPQSVTVLAIERLDRNRSRRGYGMDRVLQLVSLVPSVKAMSSADPERAVLEGTLRCQVASPNSKHHPRMGDKIQETSAPTVRAAWKLQCGLQVQTAFRAK
jgi:hypothetical protein